MDYSNKELKEEVEEDSNNEKDIGVCGWVYVSLIGRTLRRKME